MKLPVQRADNPRKGIQLLRPGNFRNRFVVPPQIRKHVRPVQIRLRVRGAVPLRRERVLLCFFPVPFVPEAHAASCRIGLSTSAVNRDRPRRRCSCFWERFVRPHVARDRQPQVTFRHPYPRRREIFFLFQHSLESLNSLRQRRPHQLRLQKPSPQVTVIEFRIDLCRLRRSPAQPHPDFLRRRLRHFCLDLQNLLRWFLERCCPNMRLIVRPDQLYRDSNPPSGPPHASFDQVIRAQLPSNLPDAFLRPLVSHHRRSRDHS